MRQRSSRRLQISARTDAQLPAARRRDADESEASHIFSALTANATRQATPGWSSERSQQFSPLVIADRSDAYAALAGESRDGPIGCSSNNQVGYPNGLLFDMFRTRRRL